MPEPKSQEPRRRVPGGWRRGAGHCHQDNPCSGPSADSLAASRAQLQPRSGGSAGGGRRRSPERETDRQSREPRSGPRRRTLRSRGLGERCRRGRPAEEAPGSGQAGETGCSSSQALSCFEPLVSGAVNGLPSPARSPYALAKDQEIKKKKIGAQITELLPLLPRELVLPPRRLPLLHR